MSWSVLFLALGLLLPGTAQAISQSTASTAVVNNNDRALERLATRPLGYVTSEVAPAAVLYERRLPDAVDPEKYQLFNFAIALGGIALTLASLPFSPWLGLLAAAIGLTLSTIARRRAKRAPRGKFVRFFAVFTGTLIGIVLAGRLVQLVVISNM